MRNGTTKSCGCLVVEKSREANYINHTKKIYGKLLALEIDEEKSSLKRHGTYWKCLCECGNYTSVLSSNLINGSTKSCGCIKTSYGEEVIQSILEENKIRYKKEFTFPNLLSKKHGNLRFDFAIFDNNDNLSHLIEYDGEQHYFSISQWGGEAGLKYRKENDDLKNQYCKKHNIKLIRIPYYELKNINLKLLGVDKNEL